MSFATKRLAAAPEAYAPDGAEVRLLPTLAGGSMAHFTLPPGAVSQAVTHRSVEEIWYMLAGRGRMWRRSGATEEITDLAPGLALTIPLGTHFQFRNDGEEPLSAVAITMPPWPGEDEAVAVEGVWEAKS